MSVMAICEWLESTALATLVRESPYGFSILVGIHILGLIASVGTLMWFDLRLLGVSMRGARASEVYRRLFPWLATGFLVMFVSGAMLFTGFATSAYENVYFRIKLAAMLLAALNALFYHFTIERRIGGWDGALRPPFQARMAGLVSIVVWTVVILAGRMMAYTLY